jgi:hypothetical protein
MWYSGIEILPIARSRLHDLLDHLTTNLREPLFPATGASSQRILIRADLIEDGIVHIAQMAGIFNRVQSDGVCCTYDLAALDPATASHMEKPRYGDRGFYCLGRLSAVKRSASGGGQDRSGARSSGA